MFRYVIRLEFRRMVRLVIVLEFKRTFTEEFDVEMKDGEVDFASIILGVEEFELFTFEFDS